MACWCKDCSKIGAAKRARKYRAKRYKENPDYFKNITNKSRYGFTLKQREEYIASKGNRCEACGIEESNTNRGLFIDHCHTNNDVKGVLCNHCNAAAGLLGDNPDRAFALFKYLERTRK